MARYRKALPQLDGTLFLTDGGIETTLIYHDGIQLPDFAAFHILKDGEGDEALRKYYRRYGVLAMRYETGLILESATWRASPDWGSRLGYSRSALATANMKAILLLASLREEFHHSTGPVVISGCVGPRGDGYVPGTLMTPDEAMQYHKFQIAVFARTDADMVCAMTMTNAPEAIGIVRAAAESGIPSAISFTLETNGRLPTGQRLEEAIEEVDDATGAAPAYYMINCAHPTHFWGTINPEDRTIRRIRGLRANASRKSHAELNDSTDLDTGNPIELGIEYAQVKRLLPNMNIVGGCCGTDHRHVDQMAHSCTGLIRRAGTIRRSYERHGQIPLSHIFKH
jgi:S-methylmethionine-dependent homocysteine/selenocysteine methylase